MVSRRTRDGYPVTTEVRIGGQTVLVRGRRKNEQFAVPKGRSFGIDHFGLSVPDLESALETLRTRGIKAETSFNNGFTVPPGIAFLRGPDELWVEITQQQ